MGRDKGRVDIQNREQAKLANGYFPDSRSNIQWGTGLTGMAHMYFAENTTKDENAVQPDLAHNAPSLSASSLVVHPECSP
jgi:hypothetical protein